MSKLQTKIHFLEDHSFFYYSFIRSRIVRFSKYGKLSHGNAHIKMLR